MKKNLKLLSGILMASFISAPIVDSIESVKARTSRQVVVNTSSNQLNNTSSNEKSINSKTSKQSSDEVLESSTKEQTSEIKNTDDKNLNTQLNDSNNSETQNSDSSQSQTQDSIESTNKEEVTQTEEGTASIFEILNSDKNITVEEITNLSMPLSHSQDFIDEFTTTFPELNPLRKLSSTSNNLDLYLDVNSNETKSVTQYLNNSKNYPSVYADQNKCNMLISEIDRAIEEINNGISSELPSTIFSLMPTITVFSDTFKILSLEYNSVLETNSKNQIVLKILLKDVEDKLLSLLSSINEFKIQLPDLIEELNTLAELSNSSSNTSSNTNTENNETSNSELTDEELSGEEVLEEEIIEEEVVVEEEIVQDEVVEEVIEEDKKQDTQETEKEEVVEEIPEEEIDPNSIILYFGDQGQEVVYDESTKKFYQIDPNKPNSEDLVEYTGEVVEMTLAEYLDIDVFFDKDGNELIYDTDTDSYFSYDAQKDEFVLYEGEVTKLKMKDILESSE